MNVLRPDVWRRVARNTADRLDGLPSTYRGASRARLSEAERRQISAMVQDRRWHAGRTVMTTPHHPEAL